MSESSIQLPNPTSKRLVANVIAFGRSTFGHRSARPKCCYHPAIHEEVGARDERGLGAQ